MQVRRIKALCAIAIALGGSLGICVRQSTAFAVAGDVSILTPDEIAQIATGAAIGTVTVGPQCAAVTLPIGCALCVHTGCNKYNLPPGGSNVYAGCVTTALAVCLLVPAIDDSPNANDVN